MPRANEQVEMLFDQLYAPLTGLAFVILRDREVAEEVVMDAFAKALSPRWRDRRLDNPGGYLRMMVVNECRSRLRRAAIERKVTERLTAEGLSAVQASPTLHLDIWHEVSRLPERQRLCVILRYAEDMTERAIAETLGCSEGTVKSQLSKARTKLSSWLSSLQEELS